MRRVPTGQILVATHNAGKLDEFRALLAPYGMVPMSAAALGLPVPEETETTFVGNARLKARAAAAGSGMIALADDSGVCVDALGGQPGVLTADWAETPDGRDFPMAMRRVHAALVQQGAPEPWRASFRCALVLAWPDGADMAFEGVLSGRIVWPMRGIGGHGYDPIFEPDGQAMTLGEMSAVAKNRISHRADAFAQLAAACFT